MLPTIGSDEAFPKLVTQWGPAGCALSRLVAAQVQVGWVGGTARRANCGSRALARVTTEAGEAQQGAASRAQSAAAAAAAAAAGCWRAGAVAAVLQ